MGRHDEKRDFDSENKPAIRESTIDVVNPATYETISEEDTTLIGVGNLDNPENIRQTARFLDTVITVTSIGTIALESSGYKRSEKGLIISLSPNRDQFYFDKSEVVGCIDLRNGDEVEFVAERRGDNKMYASLITLKRRNFAFGLISSVAADGYVCFEIVGLKCELSIPVSDLNITRDSLQRGDEIFCKIRGCIYDFKISHVQRLNPGILLPEQILEPLLHGIISKPIFTSTESCNTNYCGLISTQSLEFTPVAYGLISQRDKSHCFNVGDHVEFKIASFYRGNQIAYDMIQYKP